MKPSLWIGFIAGLLLGLAVIGITTAGNAIAGLPFVPFDAFDFATRVLPGSVVNFGVDTMVGLISTLRLGSTASIAKLAEQSIAIIQFLVASGIFGLVVVFFTRRNLQHAELMGYIWGAVLALLLIFIEGYLGFRSSAGVLGTVLWLGVISLAWSHLLSRLVVQSQVNPDQNQPSAPRRQFLTWLGGGSILVFLGGLGLNRLFSVSTPAINRTPASGPTPTPPPVVDPASIATNGLAASPSADVLSKRFLPVIGTRPEITPTEYFYRVDINTVPPTTDINSWRLTLDGMFDRKMDLTLDQLRAYPSVSQAITMECISNPVGGDLISTAVFTGVPLKTVLADAGIQPDAAWINMFSFDDFYESVSIQEAMDERTLLVYDMNGAPLTEGHGYPLRIYIPGHYGMKMPKWLETLYADKSQGRGYWLDRGWSQTAVPQLTSIVDALDIVDKDSKTQMIPVGGVAYSGAKGISKVEVSLDNGSWLPAELRNPPRSPLTWVQWRAYVQADKGNHQLSVRAYDGNGLLQTSRATGTFPDGATGYFTYSIII